MNIGKVAAACLAAGLVIALPAAEPQPSAGEKDRTAEEQGAILDTIAQINHINWVWNTIKTYNNVVVLEEEYDKISSGNLNLNRIPDEETLDRITKMLDTLYSLRKDDREMRHWRQNFNESRDRKLKTYYLKASKEAVDTLAAQAKECCSLWDWATNPVGSLVAVAQTAWNMSHYSVSLYNDYDNFVYELDKESSEKNFAFDTAKMDLLHQQNKDLLQDQWRLIRRYRLDDRLRVSDIDIKMLLAALKDDTHSRIYNRLVPMGERFSLFPEYWYYLSCAALETGHFKEGVEACDTFFKVNRGIFRDDPMEGTVALNKAFMLEKTDANKPELRRCLEIAWRNNALRGDWQISYLAAIMYKGVFDEKDKAEMMLKHAVTLIEAAIRERQQYGSKAGVTLEEGLRNCRNALHQLRGEPLENADNTENEVDSEPKVIKKWKGRRKEDLTAEQLMAKLSSDEECAFRMTLKTERHTTRGTDDDYYTYYSKLILPYSRSLVKARCTAYGRAKNWNDKYYDRTIDCMAKIAKRTLDGEVFLVCIFPDVNGTDSPKRFSIETDAYQLEFSEDSSANGNLAEHLIASDLIAETALFPWEYARLKPVLRKKQNKKK